MPRCRSLLCWMALVALLGAPAAAQADPATDRARMHNELAKKLFSLGLFREAADEYQKAYQAKPVPVFLFNLGQCFKRIASPADLRQSIFYFRSYLRNDPEAPARQAVEEEIAKLELALKLAERPKPKPVYKKWWFWTLIGAAVTGAAVGTAIALKPESMKPVEGSIGSYGVP